MMNKSNFEFLKGVNDFTYAIACAAENNYPDDPNTTLIKMRMFGEATAKHLGPLLNIPTCENQPDLLRELGKIAFVDDNILSVFHKLRRIGNQAVHEYHNDLDDAQMCLRLGFRLAVWYYRLVTKDYDFPVPVFVLPERGENLYHQEVLTLKQQLEQQVREKAQTQAEVEAQQQKLVALNGYIAILEGKQQETEAQTQARLAALEAQLAEKNAGGFSFYAMRGGAKLVHSVDSSAKAIDLTNKNVELNFPGDLRHEAFAEDAFKYLDRMGDQYDLIILDPPAFAKHKDALRNALQGYRKLNAKAFEKIKPGGILFTFSCSQVVSKDNFRTAVFTAAAMSGRSVRILHQLTQPADHPVNIYHPEGEYLKGLVLYVE